MNFCDRLRVRRGDSLKQYGVRVVGAATEEPVSLAEAQDHLEVDLYGSPPASDHDAWIVDNIPAARQWCEDWWGGSIAQQTLEIATNGFPSGSIPLPFGPIVSIVSVTYTDGDGMEQTMPDSDYELDLYSSPESVVLAYGASWPTARASNNSVKVRYLTGFNFPADSPQVNPLQPGMKTAIKLVLGHLFLNRENTIAESGVTIQQIPNGAASFLERGRRRLSMA